jgi:hypothetical protein
MNRLLPSLLMCCLSLISTRFVAADIIMYRLPRTRLSVVLQGSVTVNPGGTVSLRHEKFGTLHFDRNECTIHRVPTTFAIVSKKVKQAEIRGDAELMMQAALWALRNGMLEKFHEAIGKTLTLNPQHPRALQVRTVKLQFDKSIGDSSLQEHELRKLVNRNEMKVAMSPHFIMLHDLPEAPPKGKKLGRAQERLQLMETVYESFLMKFFSQGIDLEIPTERMKVIMFADHKDYLAFSTRRASSLASTAGFFEMGINTSVFFEQGTLEHIQELKELVKVLQDRKDEARRKRETNSKDIVRVADTFALLTEVIREREDIEVVSHEATHQLAANTGLLPRMVRIPAWVHEGLATYFETPNDASWSGIGAVNGSRLRLYRELEPDREHSNLDFITTDHIFDLAATLEGKLHGYGQAWALTHFLMEKHFDRFISYYRRLGEMPPEAPLSADVLRQLFTEAFGDDRQSLDAEWRTYMRSLQTDLELVLDEKE